MQIKDNSWHWWLVKTFTDCESAYDVSKLPNGCAYRRKFLKAVLAAIMSIVIVGAAAIIMSSPVWSLVAHFFEWIDLSDVNSSIRGMAIAACIGWTIIGIIAFFVTKTHRKIWNWIEGKYFDWTPDTWHQPKEPKPPRELTFLEQWLKDVYLKICPAGVELVEVSKKDDD